MDNREFYKKIEQLQLIAYDFDGVMTNKDVYKRQTVRFQFR